MIRFAKTLILVCVVGLAAGFPILNAADCLTGKCSPCEPGYTIVTETIYKECIRKVCKKVPDVKKVSKPVYSCKSEDFCLPTCKHLGKSDCCDPCDKCDGKVRSKKVLIKKMTTEEHCGYKWVVESVVETIPVKVCRKVPIGECQKPTEAPAK